MSLPDGFVPCGSPGDGGWVRKDLADLPLGHWWATGERVPKARGRAGLTLVPLPGPGTAAVREYRRGGLLARFRGDHFRSPARAQRELAVTCWLRAHGVPCVEPVAAVWRKEGGGFRLRLVTVFLTGSLTLPLALAAAPARRRALVVAAGRLVRNVFALGLLHPDLHPDNILVLDGEPLLVDLDRAIVVQKLRRSECDRMLLRFARYLFRHRDRLPIRVSTSEHMRFLRAVTDHREDARHCFARLRPRLLRAVAMRRLVFWRQAQNGRPDPMGEDDLPVAPS